MDYFGLMDDMHRFVTSYLKTHKGESFYGYRNDEGRMVFLFRKGKRNHIVPYPVKEHNEDYRNIVNSVRRLQDKDGFPH